MTATQTPRPSAPASPAVAAATPPAAVAETAAAFAELRTQLATRIVGQDALIERLLIALLASGHLLVEGAPGLAKTSAIQALAERIEGNFQRVQFTPDLLPGDLTGTDIYRPETGEFHFQPGPLFHNLVLADEVNRAPAKVQSALLEAMGERQITVGGRTYPLAEPFLVMATQNPIEQEGTYPLPEAQLDRFLMHVRVDYPDPRAERRILAIARAEMRGRATGGPAPATLVSQAQIFAARDQSMDLHMAENLEEYLVQLVLATRDPAPYDSDLARLVDYGASPRATIALDRCARARAWLRGADFVTPEDIHAVVFDVMRHRVLMSYAAEAEGMTVDRFVAELIKRVPLI
ncbi:AAA family ATPase [Thiorhodovibrio frisius]|uniref:MoxR-like ATPase n=1 Tax=Thiorhodovibrio frisius TaxID=631362 RepID=H8Z6I4_9GAMM|nr:MoxR family ATPase [Thiorhodovibrio frisius]EIC19682.1 MoxR-like ATPase [Thiorhodovibrio frisius]WPL20350.1 magnesium chelatase ATPase subunit D [Thiorhodovibrio frisius]